MHFKNIYPNITLISGWSLKTENVIITVIGPVTWYSYKGTALLNALPTDYTSGSFSKKPLSTQWCHLPSLENLSDVVMAIPSHFPSFFTLVRFSYQPIFLPEFFICYVALVGDAKKSSEASHFHWISKIKSTQPTLK